jgi:hypothetical protein
MAIPREGVGGCVRAGGATRTRAPEVPTATPSTLYVLKPHARLGFRLFDLEDELAILFGRPVDLVSRKSINKYIRERVLADAQPLYAA